MGLLLLSSFRQTEGTPRSSRLLSPQARGKDFTYLFASHIKKPSPRLSEAVLPCMRKQHCNFVILRAIYLATIVFLYFFRGRAVRNPPGPSFVVQDCRKFLPLVFPNDSGGCLCVATKYCRILVLIYHSIWDSRGFYLHFCYFSTILPFYFVKTTSSTGIFRLSREKNRRMKPHPAKKVR